LVAREPFKLERPVQIWLPPVIILLVHNITLFNLNLTIKTYYVLKGYGVVGSTRFKYRKASSNLVTLDEINYKIYIYMFKK
jgi:hypothetical protein